MYPYFEFFAIHLSTQYIFVSCFQVNPGCNAELAGIREGDLITEVNGIAVNSKEEAKELSKTSDDGLHLKLIQ